MKRGGNMASCDCQIAEIAKPFLLTSCDVASSRWMDEDINRTCGRRAMPHDISVLDHLAYKITGFGES